MADVMRYRNPADPVSYRLDPTGSNPVVVGDLVYMDVSAFYLIPMTAGNGPEFVGVSEGHGPTPVSLIDNEENLVESIRVRAIGIFQMKCTVADVLSHGDKMVIGADAQTLLKQDQEADTEIIAYYWDPLASSAYTVPAGGGQKEFVIAANLPVAGLL